MSTTTSSCARASVSRSARPNARCINVGYRYTRSNETTLVNEPINQILLSAQWPLTKRLYGVGRVNYDLASHRLVDGLVGFQYDADCWAFGFGMQRYANGVNSTGQPSSGTRVLAQLTFKGLSNVDNGLVSAFRASVQGYQPPPRLGAAARAFHELRVTRRIEQDRNVVERTSHSGQKSTARQAAHERARPVFDGVSVANMNMFRSTTIAAGALAAALFLSSPAGAQALSKGNVQLADSVVAVVNNDVITQRELARPHGSHHAPSAAAERAGAARTRRCSGRCSTRWCSSASSCRRRRKTASTSTTPPSTARSSVSRSKTR